MKYYPIGSVKSICNLKETFNLSRFENYEIY